MLETKQIDGEDALNIIAIALKKYLSLKSIYRKEIHYYGK